RRILRIRSEIATICDEWSKASLRSDSGARHDSRSQLLCAASDSARVVAPRARPRSVRCRRLRTTCDSHHIAMMNRRLIPLSVLALAACAHQAPSVAPHALTPFDVVLENGHVIDGTGAAWFPGDVAIAGDRIARIGRAGSLRRLPAKQRIDVRGLVVAPGFIDIPSGPNFLGDGL